MDNRRESLLKGKISMMTVRNANNLTLTGWPAVGAMMALAAIRLLTALLASVPILWLGRHIFGGVLLRFVFGAEGLTYWRCVGMFAIWFAAGLRINFSGPSPAKKEIGE